MLNSSAYTSISGVGVAPPILAGGGDDLARFADPRLERAPDPRVAQRAALAREVHPALGRDDVGLQLGLLLRREQREGASRPSVPVPGMAGPDLEHVPDARMGPAHVVGRLLEPRLVVHRAPLQRGLAPRVAGEQ